MVFSFGFLAKVNIWIILKLVLILLDFLYYHTTKILCFHFFFFFINIVSFSFFSTWLKFHSWQPFWAFSFPVCSIIYGYYVEKIHVQYFWESALCTLTSVFIFSLLSCRYFLMFWKGEFVPQSRASLVCDHFPYPHDCTLWFWGDIVGRN